MKTESKFLGLPISAFVSLLFILQLASAIKTIIQNTQETGPLVFYAIDALTAVLGIYSFIWRYVPGLKLLTWMLILYIGLGSVFLITMFATQKSLMISEPLIYVVVTLTL